MKNAINQLQKGMSKLQEIMEEMQESRIKFRAKEEALNDSEKALFTMVNDKRSMNEIVESIEKSVMERSRNYEAMINEIKEGRLA